MGICCDSNNRKRLLVTLDGKRHTIRLGVMTKSEAAGVDHFIRRLISARTAGTAPDPESTQWLQRISPKLYDKLAVMGLAQGVSRHGRLGSFLDEFFRTHPVKQATAVNYGHVKRCLLRFFGASRELRSITPAEADQFRAWLRDDQRLAEATISRRIMTARQMFRRAMRWRLLSENPFADVKTGNQRNKARQFFVTREMSDAVMAACPDDQWRLLFALSRYGGLRCPSEHLRLTWADVLWDKNRIIVHSPKTEHHPGGESRQIPLFPELRGLLLAEFERAEPGATYVITRYRQRNVNLRTQLERIIHRAGLKPWPRLFQNLRSSRQTELAERWPAHVVCSWIGNSERVAQDHYLQLRDSDFESAARFPAQQGRARPRNSPQPGVVTCDFPKESVGCDAVRDAGWAVQDSNL